MGIKHLNRFLREEAKDSINFISLSEITGKKIAVDISIYMYKYASDGTLIENIYLMLSIFRYYNIIPIFIFDGKPPDEKKKLLIKRREDKKEALEEYNKLKKHLEINKGIEESNKQEIVANMDMLKKKFVHIEKKDIENVKKMIRAYGATYYDAPGEADELCALLTLKEKVWGCLSEDMDMFVYGCNKVIRYLSLLNHTAVLYDTKGILEKLEISQKELREICIISGTDYNINFDDNKKCEPTLYATLKYFKRFKKANDESEFYNWLHQNTDYIKDAELLNKIYSMFDLSCHNYNLEIFKSIKIANGPIIKNEIKEILKADGFIFPLL
jgi:flap endonuclease-1